MTDTSQQTQLEKLQALAHSLGAIDLDRPDLRDAVERLQNLAKEALDAPLGGRHLPKARAKASEARKLRANLTRVQLMPYIDEAREAGRTSLHQIASYLNDNNVPTPAGGGQWTATTVRRLQLGPKKIV